MNLFLALTKFSYSFNSLNCHPPLPNYVPIEDADLIQVQIVTRHGARTPLHISPNLKLILQCNNTEIRSNGYFSRQTKVHVSFGRSIFNGNCHVGQLLWNGTSRLHSLGKYIRNIYINQLKFLPNEYGPCIRFRTTKSHRTLHSQMNFARGLYPDANDVTLEIGDNKYDMWRDISVVCPYHKTALNEAAKEFGEIGSNAERVSKILNTQFSNTNDILTSRLCLGRELPENITVEDVDDVIDTRARYSQFLYAHSKVFPYSFMYEAAEMVNEMIKRINGENRIKFIHWSAHDSNLNYFLGLLGYKNGKWPPYGSYIITELFKSRVSKEYFIVFRFNGEIISLPRYNMPDLEKDCKFDIENFKTKEKEYTAIGDIP